jgi:hypothetical protein
MDVDGDNTSSAAAANEDAPAISGASDMMVLAQADWEENPASLRYRTASVGTQTRRVENLRYRTASVGTQTRRVDQGNLSVI